MSHFEREHRCYYLTLKSETRMKMKICALLSTILDVFLLKCKVQMVVVQHSVNETVLQIYILQKNED